MKTHKKNEMSTTARNLIPISPQEGKGERGGREKESGAGTGPLALPPPTGVSAAADKKGPQRISPVPIPSGAVTGKIFGLADFTLT